MLKLYHNDMSSCAQKVRFVLSEKNLEWDGVELNLRQGDQLASEFLNINPKGLVPALVHDDAVLIESNVIIEYLNDVFPDPPLLPDTPIERARCRWWMKKLDDGIHLEVIALSFAIAFRHQLLKALPIDTALEAHLNGIPDVYVREVQRQVVPHGTESPRFTQAVLAFDKLLADMDEALAAGPWLVGDRMSLADIAYSPYATRLEHLGLAAMWADKPHFVHWYAALKDTAGYRAGLTEWFNPAYLPIMAEAGAEAWPTIARILDE